MRDSVGDILLLLKRVAYKCKHQLYVLRQYIQTGMRKNASFDREDYSQKSIET